MILLMSSLYCVINTSWQIGSLSLPRIYLNRPGATLAPMAVSHVCEKNSLLNLNTLINFQDEVN